jgi:hypothetical protein
MVEREELDAGVDGLGCDLGVTEAAWGEKGQRNVVR